MRVMVKGGGCSGLMYDLNFDDEIKPADQIFEDKGIKILVDKKSLLYLLGNHLISPMDLTVRDFNLLILTPRAPVDAEKVLPSNSVKQPRYILALWLSV